MAKKISRIIFRGSRVGEVEIAGSGGEGSIPAPNSVNSETIEDESVQKHDLDKEIQDKLDVIDDTNIVTEEELEEGWSEAMRKAGIDIDIE